MYSYLKYIKFRAYKCINLSSVNSFMLKIPKKFKKNKAKPKNTNVNKIPGNDLLANIFFIMKKE